MSATASTTTEALNFYRTPGKMTDPGGRASALDGLPAEIGELARVAQGLLLHEHIAPAYGVQLSDARRKETHTRSVQAMIALFQAHDPRPLTESRALEDRAIGTCRNFTVFVVAALRAQGVPARARCGFAAYFEPGKFLDHWVVEYWHTALSRWILVDSQIDDVQRTLFHPDFDLLDVPRDRFLVAGDAWRACRERRLDPESFGILDMHGILFVAGNVIRDAAALNEIELLPWDVWGAMPRPGETLDDDRLAFFDHLAELTRVPDANLGELRALYESDDRVRVPSTVFNAVLDKPDDI